MKINVAGAGAGKTTELAAEIIERHKSSPTNKNIYCIAFTNNAVASIEEKLQSYYGVVPHNIIICTIHSFLYQELIYPYFYLIYGKHYKSILTIQLPSKISYKNKILNELENKNILHVTKIPERAKWVVFKKSTDKTKEKNARKAILDTFTSYCDIIYVDEAQDIDSDMKEVFSVFDNIGINIVLKGDPKQDMRGYGCFRELISKECNDVTYNATCHRCPEKHLKITNSFVLQEEQQVSEKNGGDMTIVFESSCSLSELALQDFDLKYIYNRNDTFDTHSAKNSPVYFENLLYEVKSVLTQVDEEEHVKEITAYRFTQQMMRWVAEGKSVAAIINPLCKYVGGLTKEQYARVCDAISASQPSGTQGIVVNSIESIKGLEGDNCLFILTSDLAAYLFGNKTTENKIKNALYVALTRSLNKLTILICKEVEDEYGKEKITKFFD